MAQAYEIVDRDSVSILRLRDGGLLQFENMAETAELFDRFLQESTYETSLIDFGQIEFFNSLALGALAALPKKAERYGRQLSFCNLNPKSMWAVQATRLHEIFDIYFDEEQALAAMSGESPAANE